MEHDNKSIPEIQHDPDLSTDQCGTVEAEEDKQSDLDVPGGKGLIKEEIKKMNAESL